VTTAVAKGDLSTKITVDARRDSGAGKNTINIMVDQLNAFASEVTAWPAKSAPKESSAAQAQVKDVGGVWKDLTDNVNFMAGNLTNQVRNIAGVTTAVAKGDLYQDHGLMPRAKFWSSRTPSTSWWTSSTLSHRKSPACALVGTEGKLAARP
jgi:HAMP domain-containing protein